MSISIGQEEKSIVIKVVTVYTIFGSLWILLSDSILAFLVRDPALLTRISTYKGLFYIMATASLLYGLINYYVRRLVETRKEIEADERELLSLLELMPVGVAWADGNDIKYLNRSFTEQFGYALDDIPTVEDWLLKAYPDEQYRQEVVPLWQQSVRDCQEHGVPVPPMVVNVCCKDGAVSRVVVNTQLSSRRTLAIFTDITERERHQEELIKQQKLESIGVLAGGIAHDFNNVLTAVIGNLSFAELFIDEGHRAHMPLIQAEKAAKRATELAHQLLTFAKGGQPVTSSVNPRQLLEESLSLVLHGTNVKGNIEADDDLDDIEADAGQISQVFNNLLINAVQAMPGGGMISISASNADVAAVNVAGLPPGRYVRFLFRDQGCGITEDVMKNIFDPYFTTKPYGSGLGLASVQSIVSKHGGQVSVRSKPGKGTTFELLLPASSEPAHKQESDLATVMPSDAAAGAALLVMDDEEMIRNMMSAMLGTLGYRVTGCATGEEAIECYQAAMDSNEPFMAVIMDLTIPGGMGGKEAASVIKAIDPQARLIVSSGYSNDPIMSDYTKYGFCAAVRKPYSVSDLCAALEQLGR